MPQYIRKQIWLESATNKGNHFSRFLQFRMAEWASQFYVKSIPKWEVPGECKMRPLFCCRVKAQLRLRDNSSPRFCPKPLSDPRRLQMFSALFIGYNLLGGKIPKMTMTLKLSGSAARRARLHKSCMMQEEICMCHAIISTDFIVIDELQSVPGQTQSQW